MSKKTKKKNLEGIQSPKTSIGKWYPEVLLRSGMIEYYDISGCYVLRPWSFNLWENIQKYFDTEIKKLSVKNCYFPLFISEDKLRKEEEKKRESQLKLKG